MEQPSSILRTRERLDDDDAAREEDAPFQQQHPALYELLKQTQDKLQDIERDSTFLDVQELELASRADLDARVRSEQNLALRLAKEGAAHAFFFLFLSISHSGPQEYEQAQREAVLKILDE